MHSEENITLITSERDWAKTAQRIILDLKDKMLKAFDNIEITLNLATEIEKKRYLH